MDDTGVIIIQPPKKILARQFIQAKRPIELSTAAKLTPVNAMDCLDPPKAAMRFPAKWARADAERL